MLACARPCRRPFLWMFSASLFVGLYWFGCASTPRARADASPPERGEALAQPSEESEPREMHAPAQPLSSDSASSGQSFALVPGQSIATHLFSREPAQPLALYERRVSSRDFSAAAQLASAEAKKAGSRDLRGRLLWLAARAEERAGREDAAAAHWRTLGSMAHPLAPHARIERAKLLGKKGEKRSARRVLRTVMEKPWSRQAEATALYDALDPIRDTRETKSAASIQKEKEARALEAGIPESFAMADEAYRTRKYAEAESFYARLVLRLPSEDARQCKARLMQGKSMAKQLHHERTAVFMHAVAEDCPGVSTKAEARYYAAKARTRLKQYPEAITQYDALVREAPQHSLADDALFLSAMLSKETGDMGSLRARFRNITVNYPLGDMRSEARFQLALDARVRGQHKEARDELLALLDEGPEEIADGEKGRAAYFLARSLADLGQQEKARGMYNQVIALHPMQYYAQLSAQRLRALDRKATTQAYLGKPAEKLRARPEAAAKRQHGGATEMHESATEQLPLPWKNHYGDRAFLRALEMLHVGESRLAIGEFAALGLMSDHAPQGGRWLVASLLHASGDSAEGSRVMRGTAAYREAIEGEWGRSVWRIAYPQAFGSVVMAQATQLKLPSSFLFAVAREESAFDPEAVSPAQAFGLMQLIMPTAKKVASDLGLSISRASLHRPDVNVRLGAHYVSELWQRYPDHVALVPSSYNAGPGATDRWLRASPNLALDEWIESIDYTETRRYTRRVLQSYGIYAWLYDGELPTWPNTLPAPS